MLDIFTKSLSKLFGTKSDRDLKEIQPIADKAIAEFPKLANLSNDQLRAKTAEFKKRITDFSSKEIAQIAEIKNKIDSDPAMDVESLQRFGLRYEKNVRAFGRCDDERQWKTILLRLFK